jgi:hypothetical protein
MKNIRVIYLEKKLIIKNTKINVLSFVVFLGKNRQVAAHSFLTSDLSRKIAIIPSKLELVL